MFNVVFVCTGNQCRSPLAEAILRKKWVDFGRTDLHVTSSGTHAPENKPAATLAIDIAKRNGLELSNHLSSPLNPRELFAADLIFTMETVQKDFVSLFYPRVADRVFMLSQWPDNAVKRVNIPDPIGRDVKEYEKSFTILTSHVDRIMPFLIERFV